MRKISIFYYFALMLLIVPLMLLSICGCSSENINTVEWKGYTVYKNHTLNDLDGYDNTINFISKNDTEETFYLFLGRTSCPYCTYYITPISKVFCDNNIPLYYCLTNSKLERNDDKTVKILSLKKENFDFDNTYSGLYIANEENVLVPACDQNYYSFINYLLLNYYSDYSDTLTCENDLIFSWINVPQILKFKRVKNDNEIKTILLNKFDFPNSRNLNENEMVRFNNELQQFID